MAESSIGWTTDGTGDGTDSGYTMAQWLSWMQLLFIRDETQHGIAYGYLNALEVTDLGSRELQIDTGGAMVYGFPYFNSSAVTKTLTHPTTGTTGWRLVLRADWTAQTVRITLLESADGTATIPSVTQTPSVTWDISLATGTITTGDVVAITDVRTYIVPNFRYNAGPRARASFATGFFDAATVLDKFAESSLTTANLQWLIGANQVTNAALLDVVVDGAFAADAGTRALFANEIWTATQIANRTRTFFVPCSICYNVTDSAALTAANFTHQKGWYWDDNKMIYGYGQFSIPQDFAASMTVRPVIVSTGAADIYAYQEADYGVEGEGYAEHADTSAYAAVAVTGVLKFDYGKPALTLASAAAGDFVYLLFARDAVNAADTLNSWIYFRGWEVSYTADM